VWLGASLVERPNEAAAPPSSSAIITVDWIWSLLIYIIVLLDLPWGTAGTHHFLLFSVSGLRLLAIDHRQSSSSIAPLLGRPSSAQPGACPRGFTHSFIRSQIIACFGSAVRNSWTSIDTKEIMPHFKVVVPQQGVEPGQTVRVNAEGAILIVRVPQNSKPGDSFLFELTEDELKRERERQQQQGKKNDTVSNEPTKIYEAKPAKKASNLATTTSNTEGSSSSAFREFATAMVLGMLVGASIVVGFLLGVLSVTDPLVGGPDGQIPAVQQKSFSDGRSTNNNNIVDVYNKNKNTAAKSNNKKPSSSTATSRVLKSALLGGAAAKKRVMSSSNSDSNANNK